MIKDLKTLMYENVQQNDISKLVNVNVKQREIFYNPSSKIIRRTRYDEKNNG